MPSRTVSTLLLILLLSGCVGLPRQGAPTARDAVAIVPGFPADIRWVGESRRDFALRSREMTQRVASASHGAPLNVLVLSGGGAGGAFGAGALVGWSRQATRPEFQLVTGVSTGALIAPLAFLGPSWDPVLQEAFSGGHAQHLLRTRWLGALFGASVYQGGPLTELVDRFVTDEMVQAIAVESRKGRLLVVATTDLDREQPMFWNLGLIAEHGGPAARQLICQVLIASASVPGVFPPVMIPVEQGGKPFEEMHVDGSATTSLFFIPDVAAILPEPLDALRGGHLYILINGSVRAQATTTRAQTLSILERSAVATLQGGTRAAVELAYSTAQRHAMSTAVTALPDDFAFSDSLEFDQARMRALFEFGAHCGSTGQLWDTAVNALDQQSAQAEADAGAVLCPAARAPALAPDATMPPAPRDDAKGRGQQETPGVDSNS
jgi:hypothetical protein